MRPLIISACNVRFTKDNSQIAGSRGESESNCQLMVFETLLANENHKKTDNIVSVKKRCTESSEKIKHYRISLLK